MPPNERDMSYGTLKQNSEPLVSEFFLPVIPPEVEPAV